jgi:hypothetical protein
MDWINLALDSIHLRAGEHCVLNMLRISWLAEKLLAFQEGLCSKDLV